MSAVEVDFTHQDSSTETNNVNLCVDINRSEDVPGWNTEDVPQWHREARSAECLGARIGRTNRVCHSRCTVAQSCPPTEMVPTQRSIDVVGRLECRICPCVGLDHADMLDILRATEAIGLGSSSLREVFRTVEPSENDLAIWFRSKVSPKLNQGSTFPRREHL